MENKKAQQAGNAKVAPPPASVAAISNEDEELARLEKELMELEDSLQEQKEINFRKIPYKDQIK